MLEATKAKLMAEDSEPVEPPKKKEEDEPKQELKKKKVKWPKMEIHEAPKGDSKMPATEMVKKLLSLHQKDNAEDKKSEQNTNE